MVIYNPRSFWGLDQAGKIKAISDLRLDIRKIKLHREELQKTVDLGRKQKSLGLPPYQIEEYEVNIDALDLLLVYLESNLKRFLLDPTIKTDRPKKTPGPDSSQVNKRRRRTRIELEELAPKVVEAFQDRYDEGTMTYEDVFREMAHRSVELFGESLTVNQIKGIYYRGKG